jgi:CRP/FNR family nitrogen fixation transcriptional regulator
MYGGDPLDQLASVATRLNIRRGRQIYGEGDPAGFCYKVLSGNIRAIKSMADGGRQVYEFYLPGDFFGFESRAAHYFSAEAVSDAIVLKYPRRSIDRLVSESPGFAETVQRLTTRNLQNAYERIVLLTQKSAQERLAWFLLNIAQRAKGDRAQAVDLPMPRSDIADYLGLVIETVSRTFSQLKRAGLISMRSVNRVEFPNKRRLEELCGDL